MQWESSPIPWIPSEPLQFPAFVSSALPGKCEDIATNISIGRFNQADGQVMLVSSQHTGKMPKGIRRNKKDELA
jgi:hypothetical protein